MKQQPDGFAISFNRHTKRWKWQQTSKVEDSKKLGHVVQREGLASRRAALRDIVAELERRSATPQAAARTA